MSTLRKIKKKGKVFDKWLNSKYGEIAVAFYVGIFIGVLIGMAIYHDFYTH